MLRTQRDYYEFGLWIAALRSGKYKQATNTLQSEKGYCCLGVACEVLIPEEKKSKSTLSSPESHVFKEVLVGGLPTDQPNSPEWLKLINKSFENKAVFYDKFNRRKSIALTRLNDYIKLSFDDIANLLELCFIDKDYKTLSFLLKNM